MSTDREHWDAKYTGRFGCERREPDSFFLASMKELEAAGPPGSALDLACGTGRHALALARRGWRTEAWDVSPVALGLLEERARSKKLEVKTRTVDLVATPDLGSERFDLVVVVDFLDRRLWSRLTELVRPGGRLILRTFTADWPGERPPAKYRLEPGELARGLAGFRSLSLEEEGGRAGLLAEARGNDA